MGEAAVVCREIVIWSNTELLVDQFFLPLAGLAAFQLSTTLD